MTREELLKTWKIVATRNPRKGDVILARSNSGGRCEAIKTDRNWGRGVVCDILEKK